MSDIGLGKLIEGTAHRDAVHVAVAPMKAAEDLSPGESIDLNTVGEAISSQASIGIVDPFLKGKVKAGQRFWMWLNPGSITSLRHMWTHPDFPEEQTPKNRLTKVQAEKWLHDFIDGANCPDYNTVIAAAVGDSDDADQCGTEYLHFNGRDAHGSIPDEFWDNVEIATGRKPPFRAKEFSCSC